MLVRTSIVIHPGEPLKMYAFADIEYTECDITAKNAALKRGQIRFPSRRVARPIPFLILDEHKDDINVKLFDPRQLNYGYGPTAPQRFYKIDRRSGTLGVYFETRDFEVNLARGSANACFRERGVGPDIKKEPSECCVCFGAYEIAALLLPCAHVQCCAACATKLADNKCPICRAEIADAVECVRISHSL
jgi:hypothetical protein